MARGCCCSMRALQRRHHFLCSPAPPFKRCAQWLRLCFIALCLLLLLACAGDRACAAVPPARCRARGPQVRLLDGSASPCFHCIVCAASSCCGVRYRSVNARIVGHSGQVTWLDVELTEGKVRERLRRRCLPCGAPDCCNALVMQNREIRKLMSVFGLTVDRLIRVEYGVSCCRCRRSLCCCGTGSCCSRESVGWVPFLKSVCCAAGGR